MQAKYSGAVSMFTAMIFLMVAAVITTTIQSIRIEASQVMVGTSLSLALDTYFSGFHRELFDDYGVLFRQVEEKNNRVDKQTIAHEMNQYIASNIQVNEGLWFSGGNDMFGIEMSGIDIENVRCATDEGGLLWMEEVVGYEKYAKVINLAQDFMGLNTDTKTEKLDMISLGKEAIETVHTVDTLDEMAEMVIRYIDGAYCTGSTTNNPGTWDVDTNFMKAFCPDLNDALISISDDMMHSKVKAKIWQFHQDPIDLLQSALSSIEEEASLECWDKIEAFQQEVDAAYECGETLIRFLNGIDNAANRLDEHIDSLENMLEESLGFTEKQMQESLDLGFDELRDYKQILSEQVVDMDVVREEVDKAMLLLSEMKSLLSDQTETADMDEKTLKQLIKDLYRLTRRYSLAKIQVHYDKIFSKQSGIMDYFNKIGEFFQEGTVALVLPDDDTVSRRGITIKDLADTSVNLDGDLTTYTDAATAITKRIVYDEYVMDEFVCYTDHEEGSAFNYEIEYILTGKNDDLTNLAGVVDELLALRTPLNFACLCTDSDRRNIAEGMAQSMMEWTDNEFLIKLTEVILLLQWSLTESLYDVKILLSGGKLLPVKLQRDWQSTMDNIVDLQIHPKVDQCKVGIDYEGFLRALLLAQKDGKRSAYTMNLIELDRMAKGEEDFRFRNCVFSFSAGVLYQVRYGLSDYYYSTAYSY